MPYIDGKKVSIREWREAKGDRPLKWNEVGADPETATEAPVEEPAKPKRARRASTKKAEAQDALAAITGLDIDIDAEDDTDAGDDATVEENE